MTSPKVTVLMSVYNGEKYLKEAIESILNQSFSDFEFLIFNDCSTDSTREIILSFNDSRIFLTDNKKNTGSSKTLNKGIGIARGKYIARMDADDISLPTRLEKQVKFFDAHPEAGVCSTWIKFTDNNELFCPPVDHEEIKIDLFASNALAHPAVMIRREMFIKYGLNYNETLLYAEDYELWVRCCQYFKLYNIPEQLLRYRRHAGQISSAKKSMQDIEADGARLLQLSYLNLQIGEKEKDLHLCLLRGKITTEKKLDEVMLWSENLKIANAKSQYYHIGKFNQKINRMKKSAINSFLNYTGYNPDTLKKYFSSQWYSYSEYDALESSKFILKCLLRWRSNV